MVGERTWGKIRYRGTQCINLAAPYSPLSDGYVSVMTMYSRAFSVKSLCEWQHIVPCDEARSQFMAAGFSRQGEWPKREITGLARPDQMAAMKDLLRWVWDQVAEAESRLSQ